ncbi:hypothetical protein BDV29DRAFT_163387 [Aspergillus leporis]|uniref:P-loop containing nucleoside triphosphate hydrolase protein n=1 Tax=Aspergillus leporis TaxID=41062 RepID=A0A5N5WGK5_9EURO|nr:hypothetical protein BDV29DRAFT_163387 [Aspergillus leporis]
MEQVGRKKSPNYGVLFSIGFFCVYSGYGLAFWQGLRIVIFAVIVAAISLTHINPQIITITKAAAVAEVFRIIDQKSAIDSLSVAGLTPDKCVGTVDIQDIRFAYPSRPNTPVLKRAEFECAGCGVILLDGIVIQTLKISWLRTQICLVQQEPVLFSGTIFDNVAYGLAGTEHADASYENKMVLVKEAFKGAYAHEFIQDLPKQYDT